MPRSAKLFLSGVLLVLALATAAAVLFRVEIANRLLPALLAEAGLPGASGHVVEIGLHRTVLRNLRLGGGDAAVVARIEVGYRPRALLGGRIDEVALDSPRLQLAIGPDGVDWGALAPLLAGTGGGESVDPVIRLVGPVRFEDAQLAVVTPWGEVAARLGGEVVLTENLGTTVTAQLGLAHPVASLDGILVGHVTDFGRFGADLHIADGSSRAATLAFDHLAGTLQAEGSGLADLDIGGELRAGALAAGGVALGDGRLSGGVAAGRLDISLVLPGAAGGLQAAARLGSPDIAAADPIIEIDGDAATGGLSGDLAPWPGIGIAGRAVYHVASTLDGLAGIARASGGDGPIPATAAFDVRLDADLVEITLEHRGIVLAARGGLAAEAESGRLLVRLDDSLTLDVEGLFDGESLIAEIAPAPDGAPLARLGPTRGAPIDAAATVAAETEGLPTLSGTVQAALLIDAAGEPFLEDLRAEIDAAAWASPWGEVAVDAASVGLRGTAGTFSGRLATTVEMRRLAAGDVTVEGLRLPLALAVDATPARIEVRPAGGCLTAAVTRVELAGTVVSPAPLELCMAETETPLLRLGRGDAPALEAAAALRPVEVAVQLARGNEEVIRLNGQLPRLRGTFRTNPEAGGWTAEVDGDGGDLVAAPAAVAVEGLAFGLKAGNGRASLDITGLKIEDRAARPRFAPLSLIGHGRIENGNAGFDGRLAAAGGKLAADLAAQHDLGKGAGRLTFELPRTDLGGAGIEIETVAPVLAGQVTGLGGHVAATGRVDWHSGEIVGSRGELRLEEVGFATLPAEVAGLDGIIEFSSLLPPATPPGQRLGIAFLDPGVPLVGGEVVFQLGPGPLLAIERAGWPFAGGTLVSRGTEIDLAAGFEKATLDVEDVAISELLEIVAVADLSGTGRLTGKLPLVIEDGTPAIRGARLAAGEGVIRYGSEQAAQVLASQGGSAELVAKALRNFHYDRLVFTADGPLTGEIVAGVEIDGANPELYAGKPIELNVTLQGDLRPLIQSASVIKDLPERIRRQIEGGEAVPGTP